LGLGGVIAYRRGDGFPLGIALETFLTVVVPIAALIAILVFIFRREIRRVGRYFQSWQQSDEVEEQMTTAAQSELDESVDETIRARVGNGKA
jgi:FtsZ-interacting cell division protein ZipA